MTKMSKNGAQVGEKVTFEKMKMCVTGMEVDFHYVSFQF